MNEQPYTAHDATDENGGRPVWNVKGPGHDGLVIGVDGEHPLKVAVRAKRMAWDLCDAYAAGRKSMEEKN